MINRRRYKSVSALSVVTTDGRDRHDLYAAFFLFNPHEEAAWLLILFFILWLILSGEVTPTVCLSGGAASAALYWFGRRVLGYRFGVDRGVFRKLFSGVRYVGYLVWEMLKAGFVVMRLIYTRGRDMKPELLYFKTDLKTESARAVLANSITLTAGTITVSLEGGGLCVHALDQSLAEGLEESEFQRRLRKLEE